MSKNIAEDYYFCPECKKFHSYKTNKHANRKLCFICGKVSAIDTKIIGNGDVGYTQICDKCANVYDLSDFE